jgi:hypothetical protein
VHDPPSDVQTTVLIIGVGPGSPWPAGWPPSGVTSGAADPSVLDGYDRERRVAATAVLAFTDRMTRVASLRSAPARALRNLALRTLTRSPAVRAAITLQVTGLARSPLRHRTEQPLSPVVTRRIA